MTNLSCSEMRAAGHGVEAQFQLPVPVDDFMQRPQPSDNHLNRQSVPSFNFPTVHDAPMYGIAVAALAMLSTIATGLAINAYGPISDNAGGIAEMAGMSHRIRERTDALDAVEHNCCHWEGICYRIYCSGLFGSVWCFCQSCIYYNCGCTDPQSIHWFASWCHAFYCNLRWRFVVKNGVDFLLIIVYTFYLGV